jgi:hypothetical protein
MKIGMPCEARWRSWAGALNAEQRTPPWKSPAVAKALAASRCRGRRIEYLVERWIADRCEFIISPDLFYRDFAARARSLFFESETRSRFLCFVAQLIRNSLRTFRIAL